jgi:hypothetical protein
LGGLLAATGGQFKSTAKRMQELRLSGETKTWRFFVNNRAEFVTARPRNL